MNIYWLSFVILFFASCQSLDKPSRMNSQVSCDFYYADEVFHVNLSPQKMYEGLTKRFETFYRLRIDYTEASAQKYLLKVYVYAPYRNEDKLISLWRHEGDLAEGEKFLTEQWVYEPDTEAELRYTCQVGSYERR